MFALHMQSWADVDKLNNAYFIFMYHFSVCVCVCVCALYDSNSFNIEFNNSRYAVFFFSLKKIRWNRLYCWNCEIDLNIGNEDTM